MRAALRGAACIEPPDAPGRHDAAWLLACASLPIWSCSVWGLPCLRRYRRSGALLPHHFTLTTARDWPLRTNPSGAIPGRPPEGGVAEAVSFLWHWPSVSLEAHIPDVIRHTALRSSDFPPPECRACAEAPGSDRPVLLPVVSLPRNRGLAVFQQYRDCRRNEGSGPHLSVFGHFRAHVQNDRERADIASSRRGTEVIVGIALRKLKPAPAGA